MTTHTGLYSNYIAPRDITSESRQLVDRLSNEMGSGRHADLGRSVASDFSAISRLSHSIETFPARRAGLIRAEGWTATAQTALSKVRDATSGLAEKLQATLTPTGLADPSHIGQVGRSSLQDIVNALNTMVDGRAVFGNGETTFPLASSEFLISDISAIAAGSTDLASYEASLDDYFAGLGGFDANILQTAKTSPSSFPDGESDFIEVDLSAGAPELRDVLRQVAFFAGLSSVGFSPQEIVHSNRASILTAAVQNSTSGLIETQARVGVVEERIETGMTRLLDAQLRAELDLGRLVKVDKFEVASSLQNEFSRLESLYAITARRSNLNLTSFLR